MNKIDKILKYKGGESYKTNLKKYDKIIGNTKPRVSRQKNLTEEEVKQIIQKYQQGSLVKDLADEYSCHRETVSSHLKKNGIEVKRGRRFPEKPTLESSYENIEHSTSQNYFIYR